jgi:N-methylhydantoinase A
LAQAFPAHYEQVYGPGTAWDGAPVMLVNLILTATADRERPSLAPVTLGPAAPPAPEQRRPVLVEGGSWRDNVPVYDGTAFVAGMRIGGPAVIDEHDTTVLVPERWVADRDRWGSCVLEQVA